MKKIKILFLGYKKKDTKLILFLRKKNFTVIEHGNKPLYFKNLISCDVILSYGYRKIIKKKILRRLQRPPINLHISYLPYNRGSDPNYWSFKDKTPSGISIHEIDDNIDTGKIICRKKIKFNLKKNLTLRNTYWILRKELDNLFILNYKKILNNTYKSFKSKTKGSFHQKKDFPNSIKNWNIKILDL